MASELTDKIRAKYPDVYKDISDSELESKILAKHPEYKDLASKLDNNSASQNGIADKPVNDSALKAPIRPLASPSEGSEPRGDTESISARKVVSNGNLEANGVKDQTNNIDPNEHESLLSKGWKLINNAVDSPTGRMLFTGTNPELDALKKASGITNTQGPGLMEIPGMRNLSESLRTKGRNSGSYLEGFGSSILGDILDMASSGFDPRTVGIKDLPRELGEPNFKTSIKATDTFPESEIPHVNETELPLHELPPDLVPVGSENEFNSVRPKDSISSNPEERLLDIVKNKQGMGLDNPNIETNFVGKEFSNHNAQLPRDLASGKPRYGMGNKGIYEPQFKSDLDKALYIIAQKSPSKRNADYLKFVMDATGLNESEAVQAGLEVKRKMRGILTQNEPGQVDIPQLYEPKKPTINSTKVNKPSLKLNSDGTFTNKDTGEVFDMRGHSISNDINESRPNSLIDETDKMNNKEITHEGGSNELPPNEPPNDNGGNGNDPNDPPNDPEKRGISFSDIINFPKALKASWDLSAPGRQGLGLIHTKEWWTSWNDMFQGLKSDEAFQATQKAIENRPLFKSYNNEPSFAQKVGLKLTNLGKLSDREESFMSSLADKFPGVKPSERAYVSYLNKLRADTFENLLGRYKVLGEDGEYNMPLAKQLAEYVNNTTGRGSLGALESSAVALNNAFFSPRFLASRLKILGESAKAPFTPSTYVFSQPSVRREYLKSLLAIAGVGATIGELAKMSGLAEVEHDPTNSDFMKIKVGNTRIDPYAGMQQPVVLASRLLSGKSTSSVSGKTTDLNNPKYGQSNQMDVIGRFARSKESPVLSFAHGLLTGKDGAGNSFNTSEQTVQLFIPMILQDLKQVATENPNLIPYMHEEGLGFENTNVPRGMLALPGFVGAGISNYPSKER
jgi:hypothetical protein